MKVPLGWQGGRVRHGSTGRTSYVAGRSKFYRAKLPGQQLGSGLERAGAKLELLASSRSGIAAVLSTYRLVCPVSFSRSILAAQARPFSFFTTITYELGQV